MRRNVSSKGGQSVLGANRFDPDDESTIFVSVASYRDPECPNTVADLFKNAKNPSRVFVGVCEQNYPGDKGAMEFPGSSKWENNVTIMTLNAEDARGPMYARYLIEQNLYNGEEYYMQIDSHTTFVQNWDDVCIKQLNLCPSPKPVLTMYPDEFVRGKRYVKPGAPPSYLIFHGFHAKTGFVELQTRRFAHVPSVPHRNLFWAAGFSFTLGKVIEEVPYDGKCSYLFLGEEISMAARLFTHGWDTFCPMSMVCYHISDRTYRPVFWEQIYKKNCKVADDVRQIRKGEEQQAIERIQALLWRKRLPTEEDNAIYGLGTVRRLEDFEAYVGLRLYSRQYEQRAQMGLSPNTPDEEIIDKLGKGTSTKRRR